MQLTGLHILLTYECNYECDHCFVWGSPWQTGTLTVPKIDDILAQASAMAGIEWFYFEGGEPFMYYMLLLYGVRQAAARGFKVGIVSNSYWATDDAAAHIWLSPFEGLVDDLSISNDLYHHREAVSQQVEYAVAAANKLNIPLGTISIAQPENSAEGALGHLPEGLSGVMYRGRAARELAPRTVWHLWGTFNECPYENLREPGRIHVDPLGNLHICQGISLGNLFDTPLTTLCERYDPDAHPITGPLLAGGPARLVERYDVPHAAAYADACHLCDSARRNLRQRFPDILMPDQMYGVVGG